MLSLRLFFLISITFFIFLSANLAVAQDSLRDRFLKERKKFIEFTVLDVAGRLTNGERSVIKTSFLTAHGRLLAAIIRLEAITSRIGSRIQKLQLPTRTFENEQRKLDEARSSLAAAHRALGKSFFDFENIFTASSPLAGYHFIRSTVDNDIIAQINRAHRALVEIIVMLREMPEQ